MRKAFTQKHFGQVRLIAVRAYNGGFSAQKLGLINKYE